MNKKIGVAFCLFVTLLAAAVYESSHIVKRQVQASGTIEVAKTDITLKIQGQIGQQMVKIGDPVQLGQEIARIQRLEPDHAVVNQAQKTGISPGLSFGSQGDEAAHAQALLRAQSAVDAAQIRCEGAQNKLARYQRLLAQGAVAAKKVESLQEEADAAQQALASSQAQLAAAQNERSSAPAAVSAPPRETTDGSGSAQPLPAELTTDVVVRAPLTGFVLSTGFKPGDKVQPGDVVATLGDADNCWVTLQVTPEQCADIAIGQSAQICTDVYPDRVFNGQVQEIDTAAQDTTPRNSWTRLQQFFVRLRMRHEPNVQVKIKVDNAEQLLTPGLPATVLI